LIFAVIFTADYFSEPFALFAISHAATLFDAIFRDMARRFIYPLQHATAARPAASHATPQPAPDHSG
jgi:hypothetical protein